MKFVKIFGILFAIFLVLVIGFSVVYIVNVSAPTDNSEEVLFEVEANDTYSGLGIKLENAGLIKSEFFYKIHIKVFEPGKLDIGVFTLNRNMNLVDLLKVLEGESVDNRLTLTIPEGRRVEFIADSIAELTDYSSEEVLNTINDDIFLNNVINKYWFVTEEVLNSDLKQSLEGYLFPATYKIDNDISVEEIIYLMLDKTGEILTKYKTGIENSEMTVHELLTFASIVEYEAANDEQRAKIAGVFKNRLDLNMYLQSCATVGYAIDEWKEFYTYTDLDYDSLYNTYKYEGLPIGPGNNPGEKSIDAVLNPAEHDYLYFVANIDTLDTYFAETYAGHQQNCKTYLGTSC